MYKNESTKIKLGIFDFVFVKPMHQYGLIAVAIHKVFVRDF